MNKHEQALVRQLYHLLSASKKWEAQFITRLYYRLPTESNEPKAEQAELIPVEAAPPYELKPIEQIALDSILHAYRDKLSDGLHLCTPRCLRYGQPKHISWVQDQLFDVSKFGGEPSYMQQPTQVTLEL